MSLNTVAFQDFFKQFEASPSVKILWDKKVPECPARDVCKLFKDSAEVLVNHGLYKWKPEFKGVVDRCVADYTHHSKTPWAVKTVLFRISEAVKSIFGRSEWQQARGNIRAYIAAIMSMGHSGERQMAGWTCVIQKGQKYDKLADVILRFLADCPPPKLTKTVADGFLNSGHLTSLHSRLTWDFANREYHNIMSDENGFRKAYKDTFGFDISRFL